LKIILFLALSVSYLFASFTLEEAWMKVSQNSGSLNASSNDVARAKLERNSAKSMYLPSISINASYTHLDKPIGVDSSDISNFMASLPLPLPFPSEIDFSKQDIFLADLQLLFPLYVGGKIDAAQDIYSAKVTESKAHHHLKEDKAFLNLVKFYYGVIVSKSLYETRLKVQKALLLHYENAKKLQLQGQIAKVELLNAQVELDAAKIETTKARHKLDILKIVLASTTKSQKEPSQNLFVSLNTKTKESFKQETLLNSNGLKILDAKSKQVDALVKIKKAAWLPSLIAYGNYNLYKDDSPLMSMAPKWMAGVLLKVDILKTKDRNQEIQAAKLLHSKLQNLKEQAKEDLAILVSKTYNEMLLYRDEYNSLSSSIALADENYKLRSLAFKEGLSTSLEVVKAQMFVASIKTKKANAAYNYIQRVARLTVLSGDYREFFKIKDLSQEIK